MTKMKQRSSYIYEKTLLDYVGGFGRRATDGAEVGIEIEVEGTNLPRRGLKGWAIHEDGSLRGESAEYVFAGPATRDDIDVRLAAFAKAIEGVQINQSYRTSFHVHVNQQDVKLKDIYTQILLYTIWEDVLGEQCGQERVGNLFALRAKDAEFYLERLLFAAQQDHLMHLNTPDLRYTAVNPMALFNHGTLEYRSMRGTTDIKLIRQWVDLLLALKDASINNFETPLTMVQDVSTLGPDGFAKKVFTPDQISLFGKGWQDKVVEGTRLVQHIAHANPNKWAPEPKTKEKPKAAPTYSRYATAARPAAAAAVLDDAAVQAALNRLTERDRVVQRNTIPDVETFVAPEWARDEDEV